MIEKIISILQDVNSPYDGLDTKSAIKNILLNELAIPFEQIDLELDKVLKDPKIAEIIKNESTEFPGNTSKHEETGEKFDNFDGSKNIKQASLVEENSVISGEKPAEKLTSGVNMKEKFIAALKNLKAKKQISLKREKFIAALKLIKQKASENVVPANNETVTVEIPAQAVNAVIEGKEPVVAQAVVSSSEEPVVKPAETSTVVPVSSESAVVVTPVVPAEQATPAVIPDEQPIVVQTASITEEVKPTVQTAGCSGTDEIASLKKKIASLESELQTKNEKDTKYEISKVAQDLADKMEVDLLVMEDYLKDKTLEQVKLLNDFVDYFSEENEDLVDELSESLKSKDGSVSEDTEEALNDMKSYKASLASNVFVPTKVEKTNVIDDINEVSAN